MLALSNFDIRNLMPFVYWKDVNGKYCGGNLNQAKTFGFHSPEEFIGKTIFEILKNQNDAQKIDKIDNKVMSDGNTLIMEEKISTISGERIFLSQKQPIFDKDEKVIGLIGFSMDITDIKLKEQIAEQEKDQLIKVAKHLAHDIRSPLLTLHVITQSCKEIPEAERIALRDIATNINDIANNLLNTHTNKEDTNGIQPILLSTTLLQNLSAKKYQYKNKAVTFNHEFSLSSNMVFINADRALFNRMMSNLLDNAAESSNSKIVHINLNLSIDNNLAKIIIKDNGDGISHEILEKILNNQQVSYGKENGYGLGYNQIHAAIQTNSGQLIIDSEPNQGTQITLKFPIIAPPPWFAQTISIHNQDIVIILDDDTMVHKTWDEKFKSNVKADVFFEIKHFINAEETIQYIINLSQQDQARVILLCDYELLKQPLTGIDVILSTQTKRAIIVTSHCSDKDILNEIVKTKVKLLPKQLVPHISIESVNSTNLETIDHHIDMVIVDDEPKIADLIKTWTRNRISIDFYHNAADFLGNISNYPLGTKIFLDYNFKLEEINGIIIAEKLHRLGYSNLFLFTSAEFAPGEVPGYLTLIKKYNIKNLKAIFDN